MSQLPRVDAFIEELPAEAAGGDAAVDAKTAAGVRSYLQEVHAHLASIHQAGLPGEVLNHTYSDAVDRLLRRLVQLAESMHYAAGGELESSLAILAVGGFGRREMAVHSDVDLLFLYGKKLTPDAEGVAKRVQLWLWDANIAVGGAVRDLRQTLSLARNDNSVFTAILDARFLSGNTRLFHDFSQALRKNLLGDPAAFIRRLLEGIQERHQKLGESLYLLQPNLKEGAGGLRDHHAAHWAVRAAVPGFRGVEDLLHLGLLTEREWDAYAEALNFLWRLRSGLHLLAGRKSDRMSFEHQEQMAAALGYEAQGNVLAVEAFMGTYYRHARSIGLLSELILEQALARSQPPARRHRPREVGDGFRVVGEHLEIPHAVHLKERPVRLLTAFATAQAEQVTLSRTAQRLVRENLDLVDEGLQRDPEAAATLLKMLESEVRVMRTLMAMNEVGLLGRYLPEWDHIVCRWQHVIYHTYTVDVHSIFLVEELRRLWRGKYEQAQPGLTEMMRGVADRAVLFLGCLLHDIGKGRGGDHSSRGEVLARSCLERIGMEPARIERVTFLVRYHLLMSHIAQRRDLSDPRVIVELARIAGDRENLRNLYLITFADIRASSAAAWTEWKGQLIRDLYERTAEFLESGRDDPTRALELIDARVETRREAARKELRALGVAEQKIVDYFDSLPRRYFVAHSPRQIARHARLMLGFAAEKTLAVAVREMRGGFSEFLLCAKDVPGLYASVAGSLTAVGINILGSHVYSLRNGLALEIYRLTTPEGGPDERRLAWERLESSLEDVLSGRRSVDDLLRNRPKPVGHTPTPSRTPPSVSVSNDESDFYTIIDVAANDRLGLLYDLAEALTSHGLEIYISKAATILDQVTDTFYVKDRERRKLSEPDAVAALQRDLLAATRRDGPGG